MKKILAAIAALIPVFVLAQSVGQLRYDTVVVMKSGGNSNLKILDATRDSTGGVYYNAGGGLLRAKRTRMLNDTTFVIGGDTITIRAVGAGGGGGGGGLSGLTANRGLYATSATTAATDAGFLYDPTTNKATFDSVEGIRLASQSLRIAYNNSLSRKLDIYHGNANVSSGIYSNETLANSEWNPVVSMGINFDGSRASWGHARMGVEGRYRPYPGAPFTWYEYHWEHALLSGAVIRPLSWEGRTDSSSGTLAIRANQVSIFDLDGLTGSNRDSVLAVFNNNGLQIKLNPTSDGLRLIDRVSEKRVDINIDQANTRATLTATTDNLYINSPTVVIQQTAFRNYDPITSSDNSFGRTTINTSANSYIDFVTGGVWNRATVGFTEHYGQIGINHPYGARGHDGANNGTLFFFDDRDGVADPLRGFVANTSGTPAQWVGVGNTGKVGFGTTSSTESYLFKSHAASTNPAFKVINSSSTVLFNLLDNGLPAFPQISSQVFDTTTYKIVVAHASTGELYKMAWPGGGGGPSVAFDSSIHKYDLIFRDYTANVRTSYLAAGKTWYIQSGQVQMDTIQVYSPVSGAQVGIKSHLNVYSNGQTVLTFAPNNTTNGNAGIFTNSSISGGSEYMLFGINHAYLTLGSVDNSLTGFANLMDARGPGVAAMVRYYSKPAGGSTIVAVGSMAEDGGSSFGEVNATTSAYVTTAATTTTRASLLLKESAVDPSSAYVDGQIWHKSDHLYARLNGVNYQLDQQVGNYIKSDGATSITANSTVSLGTFNLTFSNNSSGRLKLNGIQTGTGNMLMIANDSSIVQGTVETVETAQVTTSSTSATTLATYTPVAGEWGVLEIKLSSVVTSTGDDGTLGNKLILYKTLGDGTVSIQSTTDIATTYSSNASTWTVDVSSNVIRVRVTSGVSTGTDWNCTIVKRNTYSAL